MSTVASPPAVRPARPAAPPAERHGTCSLRLTIGATEYALRPAVAAPPIAVCWTLRKLDGPAPVAYAVASDGASVHCTCPDHRHNGASCKHMMAMAALGLIPRPAPAPAEAPADQFRGAVRAEVARLAPSPVDFDNRAIDRTAHQLPEGWQPGGAPAPAPAPAPSPAKAKAKARKARRPKPLPCLECGAPITAPSPDPAFCAPCYRTISGEGGAP